MTDTQNPIKLTAADLFFSTTDARGVIEKANSVFVRLSGYEWEKLVGAPHNIIRHQNMPGAAFRLMWQCLKAGEPFCAYVVNSAADGRPYTVFATITPLGDGFLSVRSAPLVEELRATAFSLYDDTRRVESDLMAAGSNRAEAAEKGLEHLAGLLKQAGLPSYESFIHAALPAEVEARASQTGPIERREGDSALHEMLEIAADLETELETWTQEMARLADLIGALNAGKDQLAQVTEASSSTAEAIREVAGNDPIMLAVNVWAQMIPEVRTHLDLLVQDLDRLASSCAEVRFRIALARLHVDCLAGFVTEMIDADPSAPVASGVDAVEDLDKALQEGIDLSLTQSQRNADLAQQVAKRIDEVRGLMQIPLVVLGQSRIGDKAEGRLAELIPQLHTNLDEGGKAVDTLTALAARVRAEVIALPADTIRQHLELAGEVIEELKDPEAAAAKLQALGARGVV